MSSLQERYNNLHGLETANERFHQQLKSAFPDSDNDQALQKLFMKLAQLSLFRGDPPEYGVWLLHGHYTLPTANHKMVMRRDTDENPDIHRYIMQASDKELNNTVPERWDNSGNVLEHRRLVDHDESFPLPSNMESWTEFSDIMTKLEIDTLGVFAISPNKKDAFFDQLKNGLTYVETTGHGDESHITTAERILPKDVPNYTSTAWVPGCANTLPVIIRMAGSPEEEETDGIFRLRSGCSHVCKLPSCKAKPYDADKS